MPPRLLFVDDDTLLLRGLKKALRRFEQVWDMEFALGGPAALAALDRGAFDVVVSDLHMPEVCGTEVLARARALYPGAARVLLTGAEPPGTEVDATLEKPYALAELHALLERLVAARTAVPMRRRRASSMMG
ncbi:MAG TPA: response regulator [Kofleriaceae bacterium]|nr:response regulator [Kofleriaceae bacterium]